MAIWPIYHGAFYSRSSSTRERRQDALSGGGTAVTVVTAVTTYIHVARSSQIRTDPISTTRIQLFLSSAFRLYVAFIVSVYIK